MLRKLFFYLAYYRHPPWDTGISPPELMDYIETNPPGRALDVGCGSGTNAITLAGNGWQVTGVDFTASAIRAARRKAQALGVKVDFRVDDVTRLASVSGIFDLILDIGCLHGLSQRGKEDAIERIARLLAPQGVYLLYAFIAQPGGSEFGLSMADLENLSTRFDLFKRVDGFERGERPSSWFTYRNKSGNDLIKGVS